MRYFPSSRRSPPKQAEPDPPAIHNPRPHPHYPLIPPRSAKTRTLSCGSGKSQTSSRMIPPTLTTSTSRPAGYSGGGTMDRGHVRNKTIKTRHLPFISGRIGSNNKPCRSESVPFHEHRPRLPSRLMGPCVTRWPSHFLRSCAMQSRISRP